MRFRVVSLSRLLIVASLSQVVTVMWDSLTSLLRGLRFHYLCYKHRLTHKKSPLMSSHTTYSFLLYLVGRGKGGGGRQTKKKTITLKLLRVNCRCHWLLLVNSFRICYISYTHNRLQHVAHLKERRERLASRALTSDNKKKRNIILLPKK